MKTTATAFLAGYLDDAVLLFDQVFGDGQAKAGAGLAFGAAARGFGEFFKQFGDLLLRDADAGIGNGKEDLFFLLVVVERDTHLAVGGSEFDGV